MNSTGRDGGSNVAGGRVRKDVPWKAEKKWMTRRWELALGGDGDDEYICFWV